MCYAKNFQYLKFCFLALDWPTISLVSNSVPFIHSSSSHWSTCMLVLSLNNGAKLNIAEAYWVTPIFWCVSTTTQKFPVLKVLISCFGALQFLVSLVTNSVPLIHSRLLLFDFLNSTCRWWDQNWWVLLCGRLPCKSELFGFNHQYHSSSRV